MNNWIKKIALIAGLMVGSAFGQNVFPALVDFPGVPTGSCQLDFLALNDSNGNLYTCVSSTWTLSSGGAPGGVTPSPLLLRDQNEFGVLGTTKFIADGSTTTGSNVFTCGNGDCGFVNAAQPAGDLGKVCFATVGAGTNGVVITTGTITAVTDASHATCGTQPTNNASQTLTGNAWLVWGPDDDAALNAADAATFAQCQGLQIHGFILISTGKFRSISPTYAGCSNSGLSSGVSGGASHAQVKGNGQTNTGLIPRPDFNFATCTGTGVGGITSCIGPGGTTLAEFRDFQISGIFSGPTTPQNFIGFANSFIAEDMSVGNWCLGCTGFKMYAPTNQAASAGLGGAQASNISCYNVSTQTFMGPNWACIGNGATGLLVAAGTVKTLNNFYSGATNSVVVNPGAQWMSDFDEIGGGTLAPMSISGSAYVNRFNALNTTSAGFFPMVINPNGKAYIANSSFNPTSGPWATVASGGAIFDQCGNLTTGGVTLSNTGIYQPCPISAVSSYLTSLAADSGTHANGALSANWTTDFGNTLNYSSNAIINTNGSGGSGGAAFWNAATFNNNQWGQATMSILGAASSAGFGVTVREAVGGNGYVCFETTGTPGPINIYKLVAGTPTAIGTVSNQNSKVGDTIRCEVNGTTISLYYNNTLLVTATDATYASGAVGIEVAKNGTSTSVINFSGGNLGSPGTFTFQTLSGFVQSGDTVRLAADFTTANNTNLQTIGASCSPTCANGLQFNWPVGSAPSATNYSFECHLQYSQATANVAVAFGIQSAIQAPTNIAASGTEFTSATAFTAGNIQTLATTTATNIVSATPSAITTIWNADLYGTLELPSTASVSNQVNLMVSTATGTDAVTVKRGSYCALTP